MVWHGLAWNGVVLKNHHLFSFLGPKCWRKGPRVYSGNRGLCILCDEIHGTFLTCCLLFDDPLSVVNKEREVQCLIGLDSVISVVAKGKHEKPI